MSAAVMLVAATPAAAAIVAQWSLDDNYLDSSAGGSTLTPSGSPVFGSPIAPFGTGALQLDHTASQFAFVNTPAGLDFTTAYSIAGWVKAPLQGGAGHRGIFWRGSGTRADIEVYIQSGQTPQNQLVVAHNRNSGVAQTFDFVSFTPMPNDVAYHLAVTYDGTTARAYYNGIAQSFIQGWDHLTGSINPNFQSGNDVLAQPLLSPSYQVRLGSAPDLSAFFTGALDEFFVFNHVLSEQEIANLMDFNSLSQPPIIPEPASLLLTTGGLVGLMFGGRRRRKRA